ncbi:hypothetical protein [Draconibacterium sediminis]|uniref:Uncharacterized protein n=1 Tax=Draconibacterium sediminis TaxID=1544798 RepID=A0A0D8J6B2_9BACT|nr:hypothetical protein [Draconibacterium sediminis]KJF42066.1 hypothetical protein LH29_22580 [Draconibacterium sediminis]
MGLEDYENLIRRMDEMEKLYANRYKGFSLELPPALTSVVFEYWPEMAENPAKYKPLLFKLGEKYIGEIWEEYNNCDSLNRSGGPMADLYPVDTIDKLKPKYDKRCQELKSTYPAAGDEFWDEIIREDYEREKKDLQFKLAVHETMKGVFNAHYIDDVMEFESHILRYFERGMYLMCALRYVDEVYSLD